MYNGKPRPIILFDAGGITYGVNGPAKGKAKHTDLRTIMTEDATQTSTALISDHLISAGALMCRAILDEECGTKFGAIAAAETFVDRRLKAPSTADFATSQAQTVMTGCGAWQVSSYVDAQNGFGAMIRTRYTASVIKGSKNGWKLDDLNITQQARGPGSGLEL